MITAPINPVSLKLPGSVYPLTDGTVHQIVKAGEFLGEWSIWTVAIGRNGQPGVLHCWDADELRLQVNWPAVRAWHERRFGKEVAPVESDHDTAAPFAQRGLHAMVSSGADDR